MGVERRDHDIRETFTVSLVQLARRWRWRLDSRLQDMGLTQARWAALLQISRGGATSQRQLAEFIGIEGPTLVHILNSLERQDLIERRPDPNDRRAKTVHLTDSARSLVGQIEAIAHGLRLELTEGIRDEELETCVRVFRKIDRRLNELAEAER